MAGWGTYGQGGGAIKLGEEDYSDDKPTSSQPVSAYSRDPEPSYENDSYNDDRKTDDTPSWMRGSSVEPSPAPAYAPPQQQMRQGSSSAYSTQNEGELQQKEYKLKIKEDKLNVREAELKRREAALGAGGGGTMLRKNNWPSERFGFVYHNIRDEIPEINHRMVYLAYYTWILTFIAYLLNWFIILIAMFAGRKKLWEFFLATLVVIIGVPASFMCWYKWGIYAAARTSGSFITYGCFFLNFTAHFVWMIIMIVSVPVIALFSAGIISMFDFFDDEDGMGNFLGITSLVLIAILGIVLLMSFWVFGMAAFAFRKIDVESQATDMAASGAVRVAKSKINN
eukprot:TRINITY_DN4904_c0_g1_i10.p1 TRINITY_DN4904_c0_g1~~TRINITY_DN4904_c0_g1_i10.p1  ORF type:complete len:367 (+),score=74.25 TRINITY_DN4904_c0_g1_i10:87-1103(+)